MKWMSVALSGLGRRLFREHPPALSAEPDAFDTPDALELNRARLEHLEGLGLPLEGRSVLDVGCGVGHLAQFFLKRNCQVVCIDGREANVQSLRRRYPALEAHVADVESGLNFSSKFDIVFCYGLLYHLENPVLGIRNMARVCGNLLLLETLVCDSRLPVIHWAEEPHSSNQALRGLGCRPSPSFVKMALTLAGFQHVYTPAIPPRHPDFEVRWEDSLAWQQQGHNLRCIFVASRTELNNPKLVPLTAQEAHPRPFEPLGVVEGMSEEELLQAAQSLVYVRPLLPYPGWRFDADYERPDLCFRLRRRIWEVCRQRQWTLPLEIPWYEGLRLCVYLPNDLSKQVFVGGCYEPNEMAFFKRFLKPGMTVVDAGANEGLYTLLGSRCVGPGGQVWSFEPSPREFERLRRNVELNGLSNTRLFQVALADRAGQANLLIAEAEHAGQSTLGEFAYEGVESLGMAGVAVRRLDDFVQQEGIQRLDLLKMDVEGAEVRLLSGARETLRRLRPILLLEVSAPALGHQGSTPDSLFTLLRDARYSVWSFDSKTGLPAPDHTGTAVESMVGVPVERSLQITGSF
ncbi:MAG: FkbM family methyltransferase [Bryobacteraceae bacterium]